MTDLTGFYKFSSSDYIKKPKKNAKARKRENYRKRKLLVLKHFKLHDSATNPGICLAIHRKTGWPIPGQLNQMSKFITKFSRQLTKSKFIPKRKQAASIPDFYNSKQWKELRYVALSLSGGSCELCGAKASDGVQIHVDHIKPRSTHPELELDLDNLGILCSFCNVGKSNYDDFDYRNKI